MINFCWAEIKSNSKLPAIEERLRSEDNNLDWTKDKIRRYSLRYGPPQYHNRLRYLRLPKEPSTDVCNAILTKLTSGIQYRTSRNVGKALSRATNAPSLMSLTQIFPDHEYPTRIKYPTCSTCAQQRSASTITPIRPHPYQYTKLHCCALSR